MSGFCGIVGETSADASSMIPDLTWTGRERTNTFADESVEVTDVGRPDEEGRPVETTDGKLVWVWGTVFGYDGGEVGYESRSPGESTSSFCAERYEREGFEFVAGLNGHFFGLVYDRTGGTVSFFTDRIGTLDAYYARVGETSLVFSSHIQSIERWPETDWSFDVDYLCEFFAYTRSMGVKTPLEGVSLFPPATVVTVELETMEWQVERFWTPRHRPIDAPFSYFVDEFVERFRASLADRMAEPGEYGLLLSGGSDSRLIVAGLDDTQRVTAYHIGDWMNREARTAERVALTAGVDFEFLRSDEDYLVRQLARTPKLSNFQGRFTQALAEGFLAEIREDVDYLLDGFYADVLFGGWGIPLRELSLGPVGTVTFPVARGTSVEDYLHQWERDVPQYVRTSRSMRDVLEENIVTDGTRVHHHGVTFESPVELIVWSHVFPQTNMGGGFQIRSIRQHLPYRNPMLDNRLIDLSLSMPLKYFLRKDVIGAAMQRLDPELAAIPHAGSGAPVSRPFPLDWLTEYAKGFWWKFVRSDAPPRPDLAHGPSPPHHEKIRVYDFVGDTLSRHEQTIRTLPFLDWTGVQECYREHLQGKNHTGEIYMLLTFLEMPLTARIASSVSDEN